MASSKEYRDYVLDQLAGVEGLQTRAMMGEYLLYCQGRPVGGVYDDRLLLKPTEGARRLLEEAGLPLQTELPYEGAKPLLPADPDRRELLCALVRTIADELPAPKSRAAKHRKN